MPGDVGRILRVSGASPLKRRLMYMGFLPNTIIEVVRFAPLGDPIEVRLRGTIITMRKNEAASVEVEVERRRGIPLAHAKPGMTVRVVRLNGGSSFLSKMRSMGIYGGVEMKILKVHRLGPVLVRINGDEIPVGRNMAYRITVEEVSGT